MEELVFDTLQPRFTPGAQVFRVSLDTWRLEIPAGEAGHYRLAQLDDYHRLPRKKLPWNAPVSLSLQARASSENNPGTWGFGLWNDPFGAGLFSGGELARLPALPNTAWFFFASPQNYLSLRDDLPAQGSLAATFRSPRWPAIYYLAALPLLPFVVIRPVARLLRRLGRKMVQQSATLLPITITDWHRYEINWQVDRVSFWVDGSLILETSLLPNGPLALVLWIDNQYAAFPPDGRIRWGTLANPEPAWIEIREMSVKPGV